MAFYETDIKNLDENFVKMISEEWLLISAGTKENYNMMTASWGFLGEMWGSDTAVIMVRPQRYTMEFIDNNDYFALSLYGEDKQIHKICGSRSGRDINKTEATGLTPIFADNTVYFEEARLVIICKKQYVGALKEECFTDRQPFDRWYNGDTHNMIFGKIEKVLIKEK